MNFKKNWTDIDFDKMSWHDSYIHAISFPKEDFELALDIDYLFRWILNDRLNLYEFYVSPCLLVFSNVIDLKINIDFQNSYDFYIQEIKRDNFRLSPNGNINVWDFEIVTDKGCIKFESSGYKQILKAEPILSKTQVLKRKKWEYR